METLRIEIVNKKAKKILQELADLNLINIQDQDPLKSFQSLLKRLRSQKATPSQQEITKEVEKVRERRYAQKG
jgi:trehalose-6-phosphate synthase